MVQNVDFLPDTYHRDRQRKKKTVWRRGAFGVFIALIVLSTVRQYQHRLGLVATRDRLRDRGRQMMSQLESADELQQGIRHLDAKANLVSMLRVRVMPTRVLEAVTQNMPPSISFTELRCAREAAGKSLDNKPNAGKKASADDSPAATFPEAADLERLRKQRSETSLYVSLAGIAPDDVAISQYLAALHRTKLFADVTLVYTDQYPFRDYSLRRFELRLKVRKPGAAIVTESAPDDPRRTARKPARRRL